MRQLPEYLRLSASDLSNHLGCLHLTSLDRAAAEGRLEPPTWKDPALEILQQRGLDHEAAYVRSLEVEGLSTVRLSEDAPGSAFDQTCEAMRSGTDVIIQATLSKERWFGRADILRRVEQASSLGAWSYEVVDTKLAKETRAGTILQLCLYSELLADFQGVQPEFTYVVSPGTGFVEERFRVDDFLAYYRFVKERLERFLGGEGETYPEPVPQCDYCRWWSACNARRHDDDHLSLVAGITRLQRRELEDWDVRTLSDLAALPIPLERRPKRGSSEALVRSREQARIQFEARQDEELKYELLEVELDQGFARLPAPSAGDVFFDIEGDAFVGEAGLEYLFGWVVLNSSGAPDYRSSWALDSSAEQTAFESFFDDVMARLSSYPDLHIYHYTPYDPGAVKRLMGRYASRQEEVDRLLRAGVFIDLHAVVKQGIRASVEKYSIKDLEPFYGFERDVPLRDASLHLRALERSLELGDGPEIPEETKNRVEGYNRDDCISTLALRDWLETLRAELVGSGQEIPRPVPKEGDPSQRVEERSAENERLATALLARVPEERSDRTDSDQGLWILAHLLEYHRREAKVTWWEYFRHCDLADDDLLFEKAAIAGLTYESQVGGTDKAPVHRYAFPLQETTIRDGDLLYASDERIGNVVGIDVSTRTIDIRQSGKAANSRPTAAFCHRYIDAGAKAKAIQRLAHQIIEDEGAPTTRAACELLSARSLRGAEGEGQRPGESTLDTARRLVMRLVGGVLPIQGPPGAGKTFTGARMICELVRTGKRVGVTAVSHKVIRNLLDEVLAAAEEFGVSVGCVQKVSGKANPSSSVLEVTDNKKVLKALEDSTAHVAGGTPWLWAREEYVESVDVLFIDEAGQMSLADAVAASLGGKNLVLLGDPQQLEQPQQGTHPEGAGISALEHMLQGQKTIRSDRGLFLDKTWRLHPDICRFTSDAFYESRLSSWDGLSEQSISAGSFNGSGLWFVPTAHSGNQSSSIEEVERISSLVEELTDSGSTWRDKEGNEHSLTLEDVLIVAPYNAQVLDLQRRLPGARVGTVDKFQGQEAPVVIYSMATSTPEEAPHGMEFLYSLNRFNVATSRARCACILVASPALFEVECRSPRQMLLANVFCRYLELAKSLEGPDLSGGCE